jgi:hypothetical protein
MYNLHSVWNDNYPDCRKFFGQSKRHALRFVRWQTNKPMKRGNAEQRKKLNEKSFGEN